VQWRQGIPAAMLGLAVCWAGVLALLPATVARAASPYLVFVEVMTVGTLFAGALTVTDRATGAAAALGVSPVTSGERLAARLGPLAVLTALSAAPVLITGRRSGQLGVALAAVALCGLLLLAVAAGLAARRDEFVGFMVALAGPMALLLAVPLAASIGLLTGPLWFAAPTTGALALLRGERPYPAALLLGYLALWTALALVYAARQLRSGVPAGTGHTAASVRPLPSRPRWLVFPRADLRNVTRDSMLAAVALSPLLLAVALRLGYPPLADWLLHTRGVDLAPYAPVLALLAVAVHVPVSFGMTAALIVLDDFESGTLSVVRVSPLGVPRYLAYRLALVTLLSAAGLGVAAPLSGLVPRSAAGALVLSALLGPLVTVATLAVARTRVQGATADKALALPLYLPIAAWWLTGSAAWLLAPLPTYWIVRAWPGASPVHLLAGALCVAAWLIPLTRRAVRRLR
jgi:fluoroquinolone transport system permease protein